MVIDYSKYPLEDLLPILHSIDKEKYPENYAELLKQIEIKKSQQPSSLTPSENPAPSGPPIIASAWLRLGAILLDGLIWSPLGLLLMYLGGKNFLLAVTLVPILNALSVAYEVYFHTKYGATIGKMILKIKVVQNDYSKIDLKIALKRSSVDAFFRGCLAIVCVHKFLSVGEDGFSSRGFLEFSRMLATGSYHVVNNLESLWTLSEAITCLFNKKRKAIHDFIAGTIVVKENRSAYDI